MPNLRKQIRQKRVVAYLQHQLKTGKHYHGHDLSDADKARIEGELNNILNPKAKKKVDPITKQVEDRWFIDIYTIKYGYMKNSERRKNKGKSKKKMRRVKTVSFIKSIIAQPGMIQSFKEGKMGISPKSHTFKMRKDEPVQF